LENLGIAFDDVRNMIEKAEDDHAKLCVTARRKGLPEPEADFPRASSMEWVKQAAECFAGRLSEDFLPEDDVTEVRVALPLAELRALPEFSTLATAHVDVRWTTRAVGVKDLLIELPRAGRVKVVPKDERETWEGPGPVPWFRLTLSLPWFRLAAYSEQLRGLHDLLSYCGVDSTGPKLRKPDIVAHASTLGRFGVGDCREARAVVHAMQHPDIDEQLAVHEFSRSGQGLLWNQYQGRGH
jgi:hypothetical protein